MSPETQESFDQMSKAISKSFAQAFDDQMYKIFGAFPDHEEVARRGRIVKRRGTDGFYDEFWLDGVPYFQQRIVFKDYKVWIEIKRC